MYALTSSCKGTGSGGNKSGLYGVIQRARHNAIIPFFKRGGSKGIGLTSGFVISVSVTSVSASVSLAVGSGDGSAASCFEIITLSANVKSLYYLCLNQNQNQKRKNLNLIFLTV